MCSWCSKEPSHVVRFPQHCMFWLINKKINPFLHNNLTDLGFHCAFVMIDANIFYMLMVFSQELQIMIGAQWLSGRVLDSRPKGRRFEPHRRHCVVVLEQDTFILA